MRRREFITLLGGAAGAWPLTAHAQRPTGLRRVSVLSGLTGEAAAQSYLAAFKEGLEALGWVVGHNLRIDYREGGNNHERLGVLAAEIANTAPEVILAMTTPALLAVREHARAIPTIFANVSDPVDGGLVASMARPGGYITGFTSLEYSLGGKWLELLKEAVPTLSSVLVLFSPDNYTSRGLLRTIEMVAPAFQTRVVPSPVHNIGEIEAAIGTFAAGPQGGLILLPDPVTAAYVSIVVLASAHRLPSIHQSNFFARAGGLMSYGTDFLDVYRRAASYVDRVLKGANVGELPVQNPTKYELTINLKTAKALGLNVPAQLLARADEVIE